VPQLGFTPSLLAPTGGTTYNGTDRVNTGLPLGPPKPFVVTFTKPGTYKYFCDVHPGMIGYVVVKPKGKKVPTAAQDKAALVKQIKAEVKAAIAASKTKIPADTISLGLTKPGIELFNMFPATLSVKIGTTVTFAMSKNSYEVHTATFGPAKYVQALAKRFAGSVVLPGQVLVPSDPGPLVATLTSHGNGFSNTGALDQDAATPLPSSAKITFTQAGTYHFICLVHPFMHGTIVVK
jgi:plastocyanin